MPIKGEKWTVREKTKLARLLAIYPLDAYHNIAMKLPNKSAEEVKEYVKKMIYSTQKVDRNKSKKSVDDETGSAPLEVWLSVVKSLVENEQYDFSTCISKVMGFIANFEDFPEGTVKGHCQPNYRQIYKYLAQVLDADRKDDLEILGPLESAVVIDLIHSLIEVLSDCNLTVQNNVIKWKYTLMKERDGKGHPVPELLRQASENDFTEFCKWRESLYDFGDKNGPITITMDDSNPDNPKMVTHYTYEADYSAETKRKDSDPRKHINSEVFRNKPGRKSAKAPTDITKVTEIVTVMPPKNAVIINPLPRRKSRTLRKDGKYFGINQSSNLSDLTSGDLQQQRQKDPGPVDLCTDDHNATPETYDSWKEAKRKYEEMSKKKDSKKEVKKPRLYSLNPLCLPVNLLDLDA